MGTALRLSAVLAVCLLVAGCAGNVAFKKGEKYALEGDWDRAVTEYRQALKDNPENVSYKTRLTKAMDMAATMHIDRANLYLREKNADAALHEAGQALTFAPGSDKARQLLDAAERLKEQDGHFIAGQNYLAAGRPNEALDEFTKVLEMDPDHVEAKYFVEKITKRLSDKDGLDDEGDDDELNLASDQPITLSFKDAKLKEVFDFLSKIAGISIVFDEDVKDSPVTVFARDVSFKQALSLLLATNKLFMKKVAEDAIIIIPKTKSKQDQYQDLLMKTFFLSNMQAKDMVNIIRTMLETRKVIINEQLNSITLRETPEKLKLVEKLIEANDRKDAEVVIDVEILSVDRSDNLKYGINLPKGVTGTYIPPGSAVPTSFPTSVITTIGNFASGLKNWSMAKSNVHFTYPSVTVDWSKTKGHAETLTNPQIRTLNNKPAKILIGRRVPVQTGTIVATGGQLTSAFEYRDVGIKLTVEPNIGIENDVTLKTTLEVSSLGESISVGGSEQPSFNTTTAEATLNLGDGETVIIGGLLENINASNVSGVAGLMDVPILGKIFSTNNVGPNSKRELIMTLTPHIVRSKQAPGRDISSFWSGTEEAYSTKPLFEEKKEKLSVREPEPETAIVEPGPEPEPAPEPEPPLPPEPGAELEPVPAGTGAPGAPPAGPVSPRPPAAVPAPQKPPAAVPTPTPTGRVGTLSFAPEVTPVEVGQEITIDVMASDMDPVFEAPLSIIYNPKLVEFMKADEGGFLKTDGKPTSFMAAANDKVGYIDVFVTRLGKVPGISGSGKLFSLTFKGKAPGISPLVFKQNTLKDANKQPVDADLKTGTLYIR